MGNWGNFYKTWQPWEIARLQRFLSREDKMGDKAYRGDWNGEMSPELFEAVKNYQRAYGLPVDGLWGYNTNIGHGVLDMETLQKGSYTKNHRPQIGTYWRPMLNSPYTNADQIPQNVLADAITYYSMNPEVFYSNDPTHTRWRHIFHNSGDWGNMYANMWEASIPKEKRDKISGKKLTNSYKNALVKNAIYEGQQTVMPWMTKILTAPWLLTKEGLVAAGGALLGAAAGDTWGEIYGRDRAKNPKNNHYGSSDPIEQQFGGVHVVYDPNRTVEEARQAGRMIGSFIGANGGGYLGSIMEWPNLQPMGQMMYRSPRLWNRQSTLDTYRPRAVRSDYGIKRGSRPKLTPIPTPPSKPIVVEEPSINFENLSRVKARGGIIEP